MDVAPNADESILSFSVHPAHLHFYFWISSSGQSDMHGTQTLFHLSTAGLGTWGSFAT